MEKITVKSLKPADYNPRIMDDATKKALKASMKEFSDISGITWNKTSGNIVTGHHRWSNLLDLYGEENLDFKPLTKSRFAIIDKKSKEDTGFVLRVVEWDDSKEKLANITANNQKLSGEFTADLANVIQDIQISDFDSDFLNEVRFFDITIPNVSINTTSDWDDSEWDSDITKVDSSDADNRDMFDTITITLPKQEDLETIKLKIVSALDGYDAKLK
jgi:hypothetical protein